MDSKNLFIEISESIGPVSAEIIIADNMKAILVLAHGAGAGMNHSFMIALAKALAGFGIGTLRYNFPYMEKKKGRPDPPPIAEKTVGVVIHKTRELFPDMPLLAGGKSFGGRMTSRFVSEHSPTFLNGLAFYGFPLHPAGKPSLERADHLKQISLPMLFLQGSRDALAELKLLQQVTSSLPTSTLRIFEGADHSFKAGSKVLIPELAENTSSWLNTIL